MADYNSERRWTVPTKRAKGYAEERKAKVHKWGKKEGKELTDYGRVCAPATSSANPTTQARISTRRLSVRANPSRKQKDFPVSRDNTERENKNYGKQQEN